MQLSRRSFMLKSAAGAERFAQGVYDFLHGRGDAERRFERWCVLVTVFGFIAQPDQHIFLKPTVTKRAAEAYGYDFRYQSKPNWETYSSLLDFAETLRRDLRDLRPRDMIDIQSFIWVQGSDEYPH